MVTHPVAKASMITGENRISVLVGIHAKDAVSYFTLQEVFPSLLLNPLTHKRSDDKKTF